MDKQTIIDYVIHTPFNTNKNVLSTMLDQLISSVSPEIDGDYIVDSGDLDFTNNLEDTSINGGEI